MTKNEMLTAVKQWIEGMTCDEFRGWSIGDTGWSGDIWLLVKMADGGLLEFRGWVALGLADGDIVVDEMEEEMLEEVGAADIPNRDTQ